MAARAFQTARILSTGMTPLNKKVAAGLPPITPTALMQSALEKALNSAGLKNTDIDGLIAIPSLAEPHFMQAHYLATRMGILPSRRGHPGSENASEGRVVARTVDTGGAGPVTGLLEAKRMIQTEGVDLVAVVAGDAVKSLPSAEFLRRADATCSHPEAKLPSPTIPNGYDRYARYHMQRYGTTREQLAMCSSLMSVMASRHPAAVADGKPPRTVRDVMEATPVASVTGVLECARRADGGAAILVCSDRFVERRGILPRDAGVVVLGGGEASGALYPPERVEDITEASFSAHVAAALAYEEAQIGVRDVDFFALYDCFPICFVRAVEAVGLAPKGRGGDWVEEMYNRIFEGLKDDPEGFRPQDVFPVNTHGGLLAFAAPWEVPAMYNIIEAVQQLTQNAESRQVRDARRALVYGNGGIFSASAVANLGSGKY